MTGIALRIKNSGALLMQACALAVLVPIVFTLLSMLGIVTATFPLQTFADWWFVALAASLTLWFVPDVAKWVLSGKQTRN